MPQLESNATLKSQRKARSKKSAMKTKVMAALTLLGLSGLITLFYMNSNIFMEHITICAFIISCIAIIKLMEIN